MILKKAISSVLALVLVLSFSGCGHKNNSADNSADNIDGNKTVISVMYTENLPNFEKLIEDTYPDIDLQVEISTVATINGDSERRLMNGHGHDLVITTLPTGDVKNYVADLSAEDYSNSYQVAVANSIMIDGQVRYLPLPGQYSGYILNKTFAAQLGIAEPVTNAQLTELMARGREQNIGVGEDGVLFGMMNIDKSSMGSYIMGTQIPDFLGLADGVKWMTSYASQNADFTGTWDNCMDLLSNWRKNKYISVEAMAASNNALPVRQRMEEGKMLVAYGDVSTLHYLNGKGNYEYVMLPFMSDDGNASWTMSSPDAYIGMNAALTDEKKKEACDRILALLSTKEGQDAWMSDTSSMTSYLNGYQADLSNLPAGLESCIAKGYVYNLKMPSNVVRYFGEVMSGVLVEKMEMSEALAALDDYITNGSDQVDYNQSIVGSVASDLLYENFNTRYKETEIGNLIADSVAELTGADIAVVNGGGIRASLYKGDVLGSDLSAVCPYDNRIIVVQAKGSTIYEMLENGISQTWTASGILGGRFLQVSGLCYTYKPMTETASGEMISVTLPDGTELDKDAVYTVAVNDYMAGCNGYLDRSGDGYTMLNVYSASDPKGAVTLVKETGATYADAIKAYFNNHRSEEINPVLEGRIIIAE